MATYALFEGALCAGAGADSRKTVQMELQTPVTDKVRNAINNCIRSYRAHGLNIRTATELVEIHWFSIDDQVESLEAAERMGDETGVRRAYNKVRMLVDKIQNDLPPEFTRFA